jgi:hypothetical protein
MTTSFQRTGEQRSPPLYAIFETGFEELQKYFLAFFNLLTIHLRCTFRYVAVISEALQYTSET